MLVLFGYSSGFKNAGKEDWLFWVVWFIIMFTPFSYLSPDKHCVAGTSQKTFCRDGLKRVLLCTMYWKPCFSSFCSALFSLLFPLSQSREFMLWCLLAKNWSLYRSSLIFRFVSKPPFHILRFPFRFLLGVNTSTFQWLQPSSLAMLWLHWKSRLQSIRRPRNQKDKSWIASQWHGTLVTSRASMFPWKEMVVRRDDFGYGLGIHLFFASPPVIHKTC